MNSLTNEICDDITRLAKEGEAMTKKPTAAEVAIAEIREYFEDRQDASMEPGEDRFHGNKEMALLEEVATVEFALTRLSDEKSKVSDLKYVLAVYEHAWRTDNRVNAKTAAEAAKLLAGYPADELARIRAEAPK